MEHGGSLCSFDPLAYPVGLDTFLTDWLCLVTLQAFGQQFTYTYGRLLTFIRLLLQVWHPVLGKGMTYHTRDPVCILV